MPEKQASGLESYLMMMVEDIKKDINNSLKEIQENMAKQAEGLKVEVQKFLKELQENTAKRKSLKRKHKNPLKNYRKKKTGDGIE